MYVKLANGSRDFDGVKRNGELLVSYGKGYLRGSVGNLMDLVWSVAGREGGRRMKKRP
jgi:hypothetical protein